MKIFYTASALLFMFAFIGAGVYGGKSAELPPSDGIISLSPSVTESLYALGLQEKIIAVSRFCEYPPQARQKPKVGGIYDINYEAVLSMRPNLVILSHMQTDAKQRLDALGVKTLLLEQDTFDGVLKSLEILGEKLGAEDKAATLVSELRTAVEYVTERIAPYEPKSAIFVVSRNMGGSVVVAGNDGYYSKILEILKAENPFGRYAAYSTVSKEGLHWVNPQVIIELTYTDQYVDMGNCYVTGSFGYTPGPRFPMLLETAAKCIYPEAFR